MKIDVLQMHSVRIICGSVLARERALFVQPLCATR